MTKIKEPMEIKAITYFMASPDEIAHALSDDKERIQWDLHAKTVNKISEDNLKVFYIG
jgi:hypothetical protein